MTVRVPAILASVLLALTLAGCGNAPASQPADDAAASETEDATATTLPDDLDSDQYGERGQGSAYLVTSSGSTEEGSSIDLKVNPSSSEAEVSVITDGVDADTPVWVYVDGAFCTKLEGASAHETLTLGGDAATTGQHSVQFVQYEGGDSSGAVTFYRVARYTVK
ncbi:hypothetical protein QJ043_06635 [Olsenella sp. YH-ols2217]|uniref:Lipoprotein n=1 Tax=Kribbibacterium absianum TaxID=3044210 RepID=A0ABT6ZL26_9ACTN|nr:MULTISPECIES: hypothetical protein [unclassified Olsenella]MDJ1121743.1 hypothetical protein [Olsenella sp. YH-ols2216]MDJ1129751.1 hypothetical protein [Olsenella sp. YH-ols2217]